MDRIYLRENSNVTTLLRYLEPYIKEGFLDYGFKDGPKHPTQTNWFNECGMRASPLFSWLAFVDVDEFIVVLKKCASSPCTLLHGLLESFELFLELSITHTHRKCPKADH